MGKQDEYNGQYGDFHQAQPYGQSSYGQPAYGQQQPQYYQPYGQQPAPQPYISEPKYSEETPINPQHPDGKFVEASNKPRDLFWAILFLFHLIAVFVVLGTSFKGFYSEINKKMNNATYNNSTRVNDPHDITAQELRRIVFIALGLVGFAFFFAALWLQLIKKFARQLIYITMVLSAALWIAMTVYFFSQRIIVGGVITAICAALHIFMWIAWRSRIPFAATMLKTVATLVHNYHGVTVVSYISLLVSIVWVVLWFLTVTCVFYGTARSQAVAGVLGFFLLVSFYWVGQVIKNVVHVTAGGVFASWYFLAGTDAMPVNPSVGAFKRATGTSFGSICLGSLIVAVLQAIRAVLRGSRGNNQLWACIVDCILSIIEGLIRYFNKYAFAQIAIYGKSYCEAAKDTWRLFDSHGYMAIINDDITGTVLGMGIFLGGIFTAFLGGILAAIFFPGPNLTTFIVILSVAGFLIGLMLCVQVIEVLESGITTIFVCFAMDPQALRRNDPELFQMFHDRYHETVSIF